MLIKSKCFYFASKIYPIFILQISEIIISCHSLCKFGHKFFSLGFYRLLTMRDNNESFFLFLYMEYAEVYNI